MAKKPRKCHIVGNMSKNKKTALDNWVPFRVRVISDKIYVSCFVFVRPNITFFSVYLWLQKTESSWPRFIAHIFLEFSLKLFSNCSFHEISVLVENWVSRIWNRAWIEIVLNLLLNSDKSETGWFYKVCTYEKKLERNSYFDSEWKELLLISKTMFRKVNSATYCS